MLGIAFHAVPVVQCRKTAEVITIIVVKSSKCVNTMKCPNPSILTRPILDGPSQLLPMITNIKTALALSVVERVEPGRLEVSANDKLGTYYVLPRCYKGSTFAIK